MRAYLYFTLSAIFWGLNFHLAKWMMAEVSFMEAGLWRYIFGVGFLAGVFLWSRKQLSLQGIKAQLRGLILVGFIGLFCFNFFFFLGLKYTSALNAALIVSLNPGITFVLSIVILRQHIRSNQVLGLIIALIGVIVLLSQGSLERLLALKFQLGDLLILLANVLFALHHVWVKKYRNDMDNESFTLLTNAFCLLGFVLLLPFSGVTTPVELSALFWASTFGIGVLGTGVAYLLWNAGIQLKGTTYAGLFMNVVPLAAAIISILLGMTLEGFHWISASIILFGMFIFQR